VAIIAWPAGANRRRAVVVAYPAQYFSRRVIREGWIAEMLTGLLFTCGHIGYFRRPLLKFVKAPRSENVAQNWLFGSVISPQGIGVIGICLNLAVAIAVSTVTRPPQDGLRQIVGYIRLPQPLDLET
jgi:cation/acetate symporter